VVRHPAYVAKNVFWWLSLLPIVMDKPMAIVYMTGWSFLYFLRAVTEERHLRLDPDYVAYCEKVKYRFIPKLY
jgi:protein-S-isoprenylcysteine O-methyltransferase Ste14